MHGYDLNIELLNGQVFVAKALTTRTAASKEEFLVLQNDESKREVRLDQLLAITPVSPNASFGRVKLFGQQNCSL